MGKLRTLTDFLHSLIKGTYPNPEMLMWSVIYMEARTTLYTGCRCHRVTMTVIVDGKYQSNKEEQLALKLSHFPHFRTNITIQRVHIRMSEKASNWLGSRDARWGVEEADIADGRQEETVGRRNRTTATEVARLRACFPRKDVFPHNFESNPLTPPTLFRKYASTLG
jgi:hypothetical protein